MVDSVELPDAAPGPARAQVIHRRSPALSMGSGRDSDGAISLTRQARTRKVSRRQDSSTSDPITSSGEGEISSGQLFVKIPPSEFIQPSRSAEQPEVRAVAVSVV